MTSEDGRDHSPEVWARAARMGPASSQPENCAVRRIAIQGRVRDKILLPKNDILIAEMRPGGRAISRSGISSSGAT